LSEQEREQYLREIEPLPIALGTITNKQNLRHALEQSRANGYSLSRSELENYTSAVAAPIFDFTGCVAGGLSIAGPDGRFQEIRLPELMEKVKAAANEISLKLGWVQAVTAGI
jgi:IclR family KDG regulon transcriptional repressor